MVQSITQTIVSGLVSFLSLAKKENHYLKNLEMMTARSVKSKSYDFALKIVSAYEAFTDTEQDFLLARQMLKSGTAIGAQLQMISEKDAKKDIFLHLNLSRKEAQETGYLLRLMHDSGHLSERDFSQLYPECMELIRLLTELTGKVKKFTL